MVGLRVADHVVYYWPSSYKVIEGDGRKRHPEWRWWIKNQSWLRTKDIDQSNYDLVTSNVTTVILSSVILFFWYLMEDLNYFFSLWKKPPAMTDCLVVGHFGVTGSNSSNSIQRELFKMYFYKLYSSSFVSTVFAIHLYRADRFDRNFMRRKCTSTIFNNLHPSWINPPFHCTTPQYLLYLWIYTYWRLRDGLISLTINICLQKTSKLLQ